MARANRLAVKRSREYLKDVRDYGRTSAEAHASWLIWRKGKFSPEELVAIKNGLDSWVNDVCKKDNTVPEEVLESLKWAKQNKLYGGWSDIATRCALPDRKIQAIRRCILRRMLPGSETDRWTDEQTKQYKDAQAIHGARAWKAIAHETGRTIEDVVNKGRYMEQTSLTNQKAKLSRGEVLRKKLSLFEMKELRENPYESSASMRDCRLIALIAAHLTGPDGAIHSVYGVPWRDVARTIGMTQDAVRLHWHLSVLPEIERYTSLKLEDEGVMNAFLLLQVRKACRGTLVGEDGKRLYPAQDWFSLDFPTIMPMWPSSVTEQKLRNLLRAQPNFEVTPFPVIVRLATKAAINTYESKSAIREAARLHFDEMQRIIYVLARRGVEAPTV